MGAARALAGELPAELWALLRCTIDVCGCGTPGRCAAAGPCARVCPTESGVRLDWRAVLRCFVRSRREIWRVSHAWRAENERGRVPESAPSISVHVCSLL